MPQVLRDAGVDVYVMPGAETRSTRSSGLTPRGVVWHHTATGPNWSDASVAALLRDGRRDLVGPLAHVGVERDGTWVIVALGRTNHNGYGLWGNDSIGLEFYNNGIGEPWPDAQVDSGVRGIAAILDHLGFIAARLKGHKETDPRRKIDPANLDMNELRLRVANYSGDDDVTPEDIEAIALVTAATTLKLLQEKGDTIRGLRVAEDTYDKAIAPAGGWPNLLAHYSTDGESLADAIAAKVTGTLAGAGTGLSETGLREAVKAGTIAAINERLGSLDE